MKTAHVPALALAFAAALALDAVHPACAALAVGAPAPDFSVDAAKAGKPFRFSLAESLRKGPVVLYFYPKSFTSGCTAEAHEFAEASTQFEALGASVIGMSGDDIATQQQFSSRECRDRFPVGSDHDGRVMAAYDARLPLMSGVADRISYVISPEGKVLYVYSSMSPDHHVENALRAVREWREHNPRP